MQCHSRESGRRFDQAPHFQNKVPAFAGMTLPAINVCLIQVLKRRFPVRPFRGCYNPRPHK